MAINDELLDNLMESQDKPEDLLGEDDKLLDFQLPLDIPLRLSHPASYSA